MAAKKKKPAKKKVVKKKEVAPEPVKIGLHNIFHFLVKETEAQSRQIADLHRKIDNQAVHIDAIGVKVADLDIEL